MDAGSCDYSSDFAKVRIRSSENVFDVPDTRQPQAEHDTQDGEEHFSLVEMSNSAGDSIENLLEGDENIFDLQPTVRREPETRLSFTQRDNVTTHS